MALKTQNIDLAFVIHLNFHTIFCLHVVRVPALPNIGTKHETGFVLAYLCFKRKKTLFRSNSFDCPSIKIVRTMDFILSYIYSTLH